VVVTGIKSLLKILKYYIMAKQDPTNRTVAYSDESYPPMPTKTTMFFRRCIIYQAWRWVVLNIKILRIVVGGHS